MGVALKDLKGRVKRPVRSVSICLDGELWAQHDELTAKLDELNQQNPGKMGQASGAVEVAAELRTVEEAMKASEVTLEFRGISTYQLNEIQAKYPAKDGRSGWDVNGGAHALIAACAVEPTTEAEAKEFLEEAHQAVADKLVSVAWLATTGSSDVPFSARASELIRGTGSN
jgi:bifunctional ADP-heptose synthase (sugar kinase/adenylyltransferase)